MGDMVPRIPRPPSPRLFGRRPRPIQPATWLGGESLPGFEPVSPRAWRLLSNFSGWDRRPFDAERQRQLLAALDNPRKEWANASCLVLQGDGFTLWRAVAAVKPPFLRRRTPDQLTIARALRYARHYVATPPWHRKAVTAEREKRTTRRRTR